MFKFTIIESQQQIFKKQPIDLITKKMKLLQGNDRPLKEQNDIIFILIENIEKEIMGGACVLKKEFKNIQADVKEFITSLVLPKGDVWECSSVYLETSLQYLPPGRPEAASFSFGFYRELFEGIVKFGQKKGIGFVIMKLYPEVYAATKEFGLWPYVVELSPESSSDGLFHGVLPLIGSQYEAYQKEWETLNSSPFKGRVR